MKKSEPWATNLISWLNDEQERKLGKNTKASRQRILDLHNAYQETLEVIASAPADTNWFIHPPKELPDHLDELSGRLASYTTLPSLEVDSDGKLFLDYFMTGKRCSHGEHMAAHALTQLALARPPLIDRVRRCICGRCFFANFTNQRSCSAACRHKVYEQTEEFRSKRRAYMRNYYRLKNSGKVK